MSGAPISVTVNVTVEFPGIATKKEGGLVWIQAGNKLYAGSYDADPSGFPSAHMYLYQQICAREGRAVPFEWAGSWKPDTRGTAIGRSSALNHPEFRDALFSFMNDDIVREIGYRGDIYNPEVYRARLPVIQITVTVTVGDEVAEQPKAKITLARLEEVRKKVRQGHYHAHVCPSNMKDWVVGQWKKMIKA